MSIAQQRLAHAVAEERDARDARHRDHQGRGEHAQLAGAPVAPSMRSACLMRRCAGGEPHHAAAAPGELSSCVTMTSVVPYSRFMSKSRRSRRRRVGIEAAGRLVGEEELRPHHESARQRDALLLAAREVFRIVIEPLTESHLSSISLDSLSASG